MYEVPNLVYDIACAEGVYVFYDIGRLRLPRPRSPVTSILHELDPVTEFL